MAFGIDPKEVQKAPQNWRLIGAEVSEQLDYEPGRFLRRRLVRRKYVPRGNPELAPVIAALPPSLQERCIAAPGLLAQIIVGKYCDHLALYRQQAIFENRHGVHLPRQTWPAGWDWLPTGCGPFMSTSEPESSDSTASKSNGWYRVEATLRSSFLLVTSKSLSLDVSERQKPTWVSFGGDSVIAENTRDEQRKFIKYNHLVANLLVFHNIVTLSRALNRLQSDDLKASDQALAALTPYQTEHINRFGNYTVNFSRTPEPLPPKSA